MSRIAYVPRPSEPHWLRTRIRFNALKQAARSSSPALADDLRDFLMAYSACFLAVSAYIA